MTVPVVAADQQRRNFHTLDGMRGVAAAAVVALHNQAALAPIPVGSGYLAVDLFFLMSGFVIASAYDRRLADGMSATAFMRVRITRLYPLYFLSVAIATGTVVLSTLVLGRSDWARGSFVQAAAVAPLLLPAPWIKDHLLYPLNPMAWSLLFELLINVVHAVIFRRLGPRHLALLVGLSGVLLLGAMWAVGTVDAGVRWPDAWVAIPRTAFSYFLGVAAWRLHQLRRLPRPQLPPLLVLALMLAILVGWPDRHLRPIYDALAIFLGFPFLLCAAVAREPKHVRPYTLLGEMSYPAYILQWPVMVVLWHLAEKLPGGAARWHPWDALLIVGTVSAIGWVAAVTFDPWARRAFARLLRRLD